MSLDSDALQALMDRSAIAAGPHLRRTFELPDHALSASGLIRYWGSEQTIALATVGADGTPRVAPVDALLLGADLFVPTASNAARVRHVRSRPRVGFTHWVSDSIAVIGHGVATLVTPTDPDFASVDGTYMGPRARWFLPFRSAGNGVYLRIRAESFLAWAADPIAFAK
jgi:Pyridoxamine 5'-phosphate oxidase